MAYSSTGQLYFQLGHEITYCLAPMGHENGLSCTVLEEGCAEYHTRQFIGDNAGNYSWRSQGLEYEEARDMVDSLLAPFGLSKIIDLRIKQPYLSKVTPELISEFFPGTDARLVQILSDDFYNRKIL